MSKTIECYGVQNGCKNKIPVPYDSMFCELCQAEMSDDGEDDDPGGTSTMMRCRKCLEYSQYGTGCGCYE